MVNFFMISCSAWIAGTQVVSVLAKGSFYPNFAYLLEDHNLELVGFRGDILNEVL